MNRLLTANFTRLKKSKIFWICIIFMFALGALEISALGLLDIQVEYMDSDFFDYVPTIQIVGAVFCSLFIGTEHSNGTIRNKIIIGHQRVSIYLSNFITCAFADILICTSFLIGYFCVGFPLIKAFESDAKTIVVCILCSYVLSIAITAIYTMIAMLSQNKAAIAVTCMILALLCIYSGGYISSRLNEPEEIANSIIVVDGQVTPTDITPNPLYLSGTQRDVFEFLNDFLPGGQAVQIANIEVEKPYLLTLYSGMIIIIITGIGCAAFQRKDLR